MTLAQRSLTNFPGGSLTCAATVVVLLTWDFRSQQISLNPARSRRDVCRMYAGARPGTPHAALANQDDLRSVARARLVVVREWQVPLEDRPHSLGQVPGVLEPVVLGAVWLCRQPSQASADAVSAQCLALGVPSVDVKRSGQVAKGCRRDDVERLQESR